MGRLPCVRLWLPASWTSLFESNRITEPNSSLVPNLNEGLRCWLLNVAYSSRSMVRPSSNTMQQATCSHRGRSDRNLSVSFTEGERLTRPLLASL
jgi:hypothetical protein